MLKMVMVVYNEAVDMEVLEILNNCEVKNYTKVTGVYGRGASSGTHLGNDIWPGRNNILYIACGESDVKKIILGVKELRRTLGAEGIKAFVIPIDAVT